MHMPQRIGLITASATLHLCDWPSGGEQVILTRHMHGLLESFLRRKHRRLSSEASRLQDGQQDTFPISILAFCGLTKAAGVCLQHLGLHAQYSNHL